MQPEIKLGIGERPGVMFAMLHNKGAATRLVSVASPAFERIELHTHRTTPNGMMRMVKVDDFSHSGQWHAGAQTGWASSHAVRF